MNRARNEQAARFPEGPAIVAIGGGHGQAKSLLAIRQFAREITALVSVADNGGSSGRLRDALGIPAPGDLRKCLDALLPRETPLGTALEHRFEAGELMGHAFGNLLLAALTATSGDFVAAVHEACQLLDTVGEVIPATTSAVTLCAATEDTELEGQVEIMATTGIRHISLIPVGIPSPRAALDAIAAADAIILGPGSLYTSVLAALVPDEIRTAVMASRARRIYVANLHEQHPETTGYDVGLHLAALRDHGVVPDLVLCDDEAMSIGTISPSVCLLRRRLTGANRLVHDADLLAVALQECTSRS